MDGKSFEWLEIEVKRHATEIATRQKEIDLLSAIVQRQVDKLNGLKRQQIEQQVAYATLMTVKDKEGVK